MRHNDDSDEREQIMRLHEARDHMSTSHVLAELARRYIKDEQTTRDDSTRMVMRDRALILLDAARALGPSCCSYHKDRGDLLRDCLGREVSE